MADQKIEPARVSVRNFCTSCNREVSKVETSREQTIVVNGDRVVAINDKLLHRECGGVVLALSLLN